MASIFQDLTERELGRVRLRLSGQVSYVLLVKLYFSVSPISTFHKNDN